MVFSPLRLLLPRWFPAFEKQMPNASWRRRGVASARGGGSPTLWNGAQAKWKGRRAAQAQRGSLGIPLVRARGGAPLSVFCFCCCFSGMRAGVAGRNRPAEEGGEGPEGRRQGGYLLPAHGFRKSRKPAKEPERNRALRDCGRVGARLRRIGAIITAIFAENMLACAANGS
jgi:hypothetical protein